MSDLFNEKLPETLFVKLLKEQRKNIKKIGNYGKLSFDDIKRIDKYLRDNIFVLDQNCYTYYLLLDLMN